MTSTEQVLHWMCRDYDSAEHWKMVGKVFYLASVEPPFGDADSTTARQKFACHLQHIFEFLTPKPLHVQQWSKDFFGTEEVSVPIPETDSVEWEFIADYFLLSVTSTSKEIEDMNSARKIYFMKQEGRLESNIKRAERHFEKIVNYMQSQGISLPKNRIDGTVIDIRKRVTLIEEKNKQNVIKNAVVSSYLSIAEE